MGRDFGHLCGTLRLLVRRKRGVLCLRDREMFALPRPLATVSRTSSCELITLNLQPGSWTMFLTTSGVIGASTDIFFVHLCQYSFVRRWTCFNLSLNRFHSSNNSGDEHGSLRNKRIWFGVNASKSCGSVERGVIGLSFKIYLLHLEIFLGLLHLRDVLLPLECRILLMRHLDS